MSLDERDIANAVRLLPPELKALMLATQGLVVAGGLVRAAVTGERVSDVDVFAPGPAIAMSMAEAYKGKFKTWDARQVDTPNAITIIAKHRKAVQFITRWTFDDPHLLVYSFDFSIARAAIWYEQASSKWVSSCDSRFYPDLAARRLVFMQPKDNTAGGTLLRVQKFIRLGYRINAFQMARIVVNVAAQAGGGPELADEITRMVREVDPRSPEWADQPVETVESAAQPAADEDDPTF